MEIDDLGDVAVWRWVGIHGFSEKDRERVTMARQHFRNEIRPSHGVLLDLSRLRYTYSDGLADAVGSISLLRSLGHHVAILVSPAAVDTEKRVRILGIELPVDSYVHDVTRTRLRSMGVEEVVAVFEEEDLALAFLRSGPTTDLD